jgi:hypothetical protein
MRNHKNTDRRKLTGAGLKAPMIATMIATLIVVAMPAAATSFHAVKPGTWSFDYATQTSVMGTTVNHDMHMVRCVAKSTIANALPTAPGDQCNKPVVTDLGNGSYRVQDVCRSFEHGESASVTESMVMRVATDGLSMSGKGAIESRMTGNMPIAIPTINTSINFSGQRTSASCVAPVGPRQYAG